MSQPSLFQIGGNGMHLTADKIVKMLQEAQLDSVRIGVVRRWMTSLPGVATECPMDTPYGKVRRMQ